MLYSVGQNPMEQLGRHVLVGLHIAQSVEHLFLGQTVEGSIPSTLKQNAKTDPVHDESDLIPCTHVNKDIPRLARLRSVNGKEHGGSQAFTARKVDGIPNVE